MQIDKEIIKMMLITNYYKRIEYPIDVTVVDDKFEVDYYEIMDSGRKVQFSMILLIDDYNKQFLLNRRKKIEKIRHGSK